LPLAVEKPQCFGGFAGEVADRELGYRLLDFASEFRQLDKLATRNTGRLDPETVVLLNRSLAVVFGLAG
jgi:hypothetical protein